MNSTSLQRRRTPHRDRRTGRIGPWLFPVLAILPSLGYGIFAAVAYLHYPAAYSPLHNTLSELGSPNLNPAGAPFYRVGCVIGGITTVTFFLCLGPWRGSGTWLQNRLLTVVQALGVLAGMAMLLFAVYADNESAVHRIVLGILANSSLAFLLLSIFALRRGSEGDGVRTATALTASGAIVLMYALPAYHWAEWLPAILAQIYLWVLGIQTGSIAVSGPASGQEPG